MSVLINASTSTGLVQSADTSGVIELQSNGTTALTVNTNEGIQILNCLGVGNATPSTSGAGITFPASQSASSDANTLDDYEEGTWTPTIIGTTTAGTASYSQNAARYTKIGRMVFIETYISWSGGTGSGNLRLAGLPFTAANVDVFPGFVISYFENVAMTANNFPMLYVVKNNTEAVFVQCPTGGGANNSIPYDAAGAIQLSGCYTV